MAPTRRTTLSFRLLTGYIYLSMQRRPFISASPITVYLNAILPVQSRIIRTYCFVSQHARCIHMNANEQFQTESLLLLCPQLQSLFKSPVITKYDVIHVRSRFSSDPGLYGGAVGSGRSRQVAARHTRLVRWLVGSCSLISSRQVGSGLQPVFRVVAVKAG